MSNPSRSGRSTGRNPFRSPLPGVPKALLSALGSPPDPIETYDLCHPAVPAALDGLTILHITDAHVRTPQGKDPAFNRLLHALAWTAPDITALTGDYMTEPGDETHALDALMRLRDAWKADLGVFGVFGNHDSHEFKLAARQIEGITWVENRVVDFQPRLPLRLACASYPEDLFGAMIHDPIPWEPSRDASTFPWPSLPDDQPPTPLTLAISHYPTEIFPAADLGIPLVLAGHTHGGQIRPWKGHVPHTSSDFPSHLATGVLRLRNTICCVSRGVGEAYVGLRLNCPRQAPLYTLRRGQAPRGRRIKDGDYTTLTQVVA